jgi:hypothetical protein
MQPLGLPVGKQGLGSFCSVDGAVIQSQMRGNAWVALAHQRLTPGSEIGTTHTALLEPHADWFQIKITAAGTIEPRTCTRLHLMSMGLPFGRPSLRQGRVFGEATFITKQYPHKAGSFLCQMHLNFLTDFFKPQGVSFFLNCSASFESSCLRVSRYQPRRNVRSSRSWGPTSLP